MSEAGEGLQALCRSCSDQLCLGSPAGTPPSASHEDAAEVEGGRTVLSWREGNGPSRDLGDRDLGDSGFGLHTFSVVGISVDERSETRILMLL